MTDEPIYEVYALRYAEARRVAGDVFLSRDPHDAPVDMDYFVWLVRAEDRQILVDTGFGPEAAAARKRGLLRTVDTALLEFGVDPGAIEDVIITHLHYDHAGNLPLFPNARFHLQDTEMGFATGRFMCHAHLNVGYDVEDVCCMVRRVYAGRVHFHDGDATIAPGISVHRLGGHTDGLMAVRVATKRGPVVLASDTMHYYANKQRNDPFSSVFDVGASLKAFRALEQLAGADDRIIPGHDPLVCQIFPRVGHLDAFSLHEPPQRTLTSTRAA